MPRIDRERGVSVVPWGRSTTIRDASGGRHIFAARSAWYDIPDDLPQHAEYPPST